jgi:Raf kinase inhibitor-like YbhB/YbcL family protein
MLDVYVQAIVNVPFQISAQDFDDGAGMPIRFTCDGEDVSPALRWTGEPSGTKSFALIMDDPDAPRGTWNHWLLWDIPAQIHSLPEGNEPASMGKSGMNDFGRYGYGGPCPPKRGGPHRYFFRLFALDTATLGLAKGAKRPALEKAIRKHTIAQASYMGRYERQ